MIHELYGKKSEIWAVDDDMRVEAENLIAFFPDELGHIDLSNVIFVRAAGIPVKKDGVNWYGKTWHMKPPVSIVSRYVIRKLAQKGCLTGSTNIDEGESDLLDLGYIIGLNSDAIHFTAVGDVDLAKKMEEITLHHELLHIKIGMDGLMPHPIQDFAEILDRYGVHWSKGAINESLQKGDMGKALVDFTRKVASGAVTFPKTADESD